MSPVAPVRRLPVVAALHEDRPARALLLVTFDWSRPKDPRTPLGHASLVASLRGAGVPVESHLRSVNEPGFDEAAEVAAVVERATRLDADVGLGTYVWNDGIVRRVVEGLRSAGFSGRIVLGGPQVTYAGRELEATYPGVDAFVRGAGERALVALATARDRRPVEGVHWRGLPDGLERAEVELATLPSPFTQGIVDVAAQPFVRWETHRGCVFRCSFCQHPGAEHRVRPFDRARIDAELDLFLAAGVRDLCILDPVFNLGPHAVHVLRRLVAAGWRGRLSVQAHFERLSDELLGLLATLGATPEFGLQTIVPEEMRAIERVNRRDRVEDGMARLARLGLPYEVTLIYGLPRQTLASFEESIDFCLRRGVPVLKAWPLMLLRGTALARDRALWRLRENADPIPAVVASDTFDEADWRRMDHLAAALRATEGRHPATVEALKRVLA